MPRLDHLRTAVLRAWRGFAVWWVRSAVSVARLAGFEVTGAARAAWGAGRGCGRGCWPGLRYATVVRPGRRRHPEAWLAGLLISECFASDCGGGGAGPGSW